MKKPCTRGEIHVNYSRELICFFTMIHIRLFPLFVQKHYYNTVLERRMYTARELVSVFFCKNSAR